MPPRIDYPDPGTWLRVIDSWQIRRNHRFDDTRFMLSFSQHVKFEYSISIVHVGHQT